MMQRDARRFLYPLVVVFAIGLLGLAPAQAADLKTGTLSGGGAIGFLTNTPAGAAFAFNANAHYFIHQNVSVGPLFQLAPTWGLFQFGLSGPGELCIDLPGTEDKARITL